MSTNICNNGLCLILNFALRVPLIPTVSGANETRLIVSVIVVIIVATVAAQIHVSYNFSLSIMPP